jgi:hypothetical protein
MSQPPAFTFFPWLRRGLAAGIEQDDDANALDHVSLLATATTGAGDARPIKLRLMGPDAACRPCSPDRDHAGVGIEIIYPHRGKFRISAAGQQRTANKIAERRFAGID